MSNYTWLLIGAAVNLAGAFLNVYVSYRNRKLIVGIKENLEESERLIGLITRKGELIATQERQIKESDFGKHIN